MRQRRRATRMVAALIMGRGYKGMPARRQWIGDQLALLFVHHKSERKQPPSERREVRPFSKRGNPKHREPGMRAHPLVDAKTDGEKAVMPGQRNDLAPGKYIILARARKRNGVSRGCKPGERNE